MEKLKLNIVIVVQITLSRPNIDRSCLHTSISALLCRTGHLRPPELAPAPACRPQWSSASRAIINLSEAVVGL